jgi:hypothetical protein
MSGADRVGAAAPATDRSDFAVAVTSYALSGEEKKVREVGRERNAVAVGRDLESGSFRVPEEVAQRNQFGSIHENTP